MAGITLAQAEAQLQAYLTASEKISVGQSYKIGDRDLTRADLGAVMESITFWDSKVKELSGSAHGGVRVGLAIPR